MRLIALALVVATVAAGAWLSLGSEEPQKSAKAPAPSAGKPQPAAAKGDAANDSDGHDGPVKALISGKVVALGEALEQRGIKSYAEEVKDQFVLFTEAKEVVPIVADWRGRAFYQDERLRNRPVDLVVNRRRDVPWVQVLSIYLFDEKGERQIMDYWCDICAIPMYEIKECECCQGPTRLRLRPQELPQDIARPASLKKRKPEGRAGN